MDATGVGGSVNSGAKKIVDGALQATMSNVDPISGAVTTTSASFRADDFSRVLRSYWKPDGNTINPQNEAKLKKWMQSNGIPSENGITFFLEGDKFTQARRKAIADLGLSAK